MAIIINQQQQVNNSASDRRYEEMETSAAVY
jgi:hypothetical protein